MQRGPIARPGRWRFQTSPLVRSSQGAHIAVPPQPSKRLESALAAPFGSLALRPSAPPAAGCRTERVDLWAMSLRLLERRAGAHVLALPPRADRRRTEQPSPDRIHARAQTAGPSSHRSTRPPLQLHIPCPPISLPPSGTSPKTSSSSSRPRAQAQRLSPQVLFRCRGTQRRAGTPSRCSKLAVARSTATLRRPRTQRIAMTTAMATTTPGGTSKWRRRPCPLSRPTCRPLVLLPRRAHTLPRGQESCEP